MSATQTQSEITTATTYTSQVDGRQVREVREGGEYRGYISQTSEGGRPWYGHAVEAKEYRPGQRQASYGPFSSAAAAARWTADRWHALGEVVRL